MVRFKTPEEAAEWAMRCFYGDNPLRCGMCLRKMPQWNAEEYCPQCTMVLRDLS